MELSHSFWVGVFFLPFAYLISLDDVKRKVEELSVFCDRLMEVDSKRSELNRNVMTYLTIPFT